MAGSHGHSGGRMSTPGGGAIRLLAADDRCRARAPARAERRASAASLVFGELYGSGVQDMAYGLAGGAKGFRAFDISPSTASTSTTTPRPRRWGAAASRWCPPSTGGRSHGRRSRSTPRPERQMCPPDAAGRFGGREGCVITPVIERYHAGAGRLGPGDPQVDLGRFLAHRGARMSIEKPVPRGADAVSQGGCNPPEIMA